jgi:uncharacterized protein YkwD
MLKKNVLIPMFILFLLTGIMSYADSTISVFYNNTPMPLKPSPTIINGRTLIPLRSIMETFGAEVTWNPIDQSILITRQDAIITLQIDNLVADVNGRNLALDTPPKLIDSRTFVPIRFISESLNLLVRWDSKNQTVYISDYAHTSFEAITVGLNEESVYTALGDPSRRDLSIYGFQWLIYNEGTASYKQIGIKNGKVVASYGFDIDTITNGLLKPLMKREEVVKILGSCLTSIQKGNTTYSLGSSFSETFKIGQLYYTCYYDTSLQKKLYAVSIIDATVEENFKGLSGTPSKTLVSSLELEVFDITNAYRVYNGLSPLAFSEALHTTAQRHSLDMATRQYFNHTSPDGKTLKDRILSLFSKYSSIGENIAVGAADARQAFDLWVHSPGHLAIILGDYDQLGAGVAFGTGSKPYYTQHFIKNGVLK